MDLLHLQLLVVGLSSRTTCYLKHQHEQGEHDADVPNSIQVHEGSSSRDVQTHHRRSTFDISADSEARPELPPSLEALLQQRVNHPEVLMSSKRFLADPDGHESLLRGIDESTATTA